MMFEDKTINLYKLIAEHEKKIDWILKESLATFLPERDPQLFAKNLAIINMLDQKCRELRLAIETISTKEESFVKGAA